MDQVKTDLREFWFDGNHVPLCPNYVIAKSARECELEDCKYSHEMIEYRATLPVPLDKAADFDTLFNWVMEQIQAQNVAFEAFTSEDLVTGSHMDQLNDLMDEMGAFEDQPEPLANVCPFYRDTGNCPQEACPYSHSMPSSEDIQKAERAQQWHPSSRNCECCRGYKFGCQKEECKAGGCMACQ